MCTNIQFKIGHGIIAVALFGLLLLSMMPTILGNSSIIQSALAQPEDSFPTPANDTLTPAQRSAREQLLKQEGFSVNTTNLPTHLKLLIETFDSHNK